MSMANLQNRDGIMISVPHTITSEGQVRNSRLMFMHLSLLVVVGSFSLPALGQYTGVLPPSLLNTNGFSDSGVDNDSDLATDGNGFVVAVWRSTSDILGNGNDGDLFVSTSSDYGLTWTAPALLNSFGLTDSLDDFRPRLVKVESSSTWVCVWSSYNDFLGSGTEGAIMFTRSTDGGTTWSAAQLLNSNASIDGAWDLHGEIANPFASTLVTVWVSPSDSDNDIYFSRSTDAGLTWSAKARLNSTGSSDSHDDFEPVIANIGLFNDSLVCVWTSNNPAGGVGADRDMFASLSANGGATWSAPALVNSNGTSDSVSTADDHPYITSYPISTLETGVAVIFNSQDSIVGNGNDGDIFVVYASSALSWTSPYLVNATGMSDSAVQDSARIEYAGSPFSKDKGFVATYLESGDVLGNGTDGDWFVARTLGFSGWLFPQLVNLNGFSDTGFDIGDSLEYVGPDGTGTVLSGWSSNGNLLGNGSDRDAHLTRLVLPDVNLLNDFGASDSGADDSPRIAMAPGASVAVFQSQSDISGSGTDSDIFFQRYAPQPPYRSAGTFLLNTNGTSDGASVDIEPDIATDGAGNWVAVWSSGANIASNGTEGDILCATSTTDGSTWGAPVLVNATGLADSTEDVMPRIATDRNGRWVCVWVGRILGGDPDIFAAVSLDNGATWGLVSSVNSYGSSDSFGDDSPSLAVDDFGNWVAVWSAGSATDFDISYAQSTDGSNWGTSFLLNTNALSDAGDDNTPEIATDGHGAWMTVWSSDSDYIGSGTDTDILYATSFGAGWSAPGVLNDGGLADTAPNVRPQIESDGTGNWVSTYYTSNLLHQFQISRNNGASWGSAGFSRGGSGGLDYSVASNGDGKWASTFSSTQSLLGNGTDGDTFVSSFELPVFPVVTSIVPSTAGPTNATSVSFTVAFNRDVVNFDAAGDLILSHTGTANTGVVISGGPKIYTVDITGITGDGSFTLAASTGSDVLSTYDYPLTWGGLSTDVVIDQTPPTLSISAPSSTLTASGPVTYTLTYGGADAVDLLVGDITLNKTGTADGVVSVSGSGLTTRTVTINTITGTGALGISVASGTASDSASNDAPAAGPSATFQVDNTSPDIDIGAPSTSDTTSGPVTFGVTYTGATSVNLTTGDITLNTTGTAAATIGVTNGTTSTPTVTLSAVSGDGTLGISVNAGTSSDAASNTDAGAGPSTTFNVDNTAPGVSIGAPSATDANSGPVTFGVTYTGATSVNLTTGDVTLNTTGTATATLGVTNGTTSTPTVTLSAISGDGTLGITVNAGTSSDAASNTDAGAGPSTTFNVDNTAPGVSSIVVSGAKGASVDFIVTFSESVTGVDTSDFALTTTGGITGESVTGVAGSGTTYTVTVDSGTGIGTIRVDVIDDDSITDSAGNPLGGPGAGNGNFTAGGVYSNGVAMPVSSNYGLVLLGLMIAMGAGLAVWRAMKRTSTEN